MVRLAISVEGPTEERFIKVVVTPHLQSLDIYALRMCQHILATGVNCDSHA